MKKKGILNKQFAAEVASLGHGDVVVISNAGLPVPAGVNCVDLAVTRNVPTVYQVLDAFLQENVVEQVYMSAGGEKVSPKFYSDMGMLFKAQTITQIPHEEFKEKCKAAKVFVRTADYTGFGSLILVTAPQSDAAVEKYDVDTSILKESK